MKGRGYWEIGGFLAGGVLILFGVVAIFMGANGFNTTRDSIKGEGITFGTADDPAVAKYADQWAGEQVTTGDQARAFAKIMRMHVLESTGGLTYAAMGRFQSAAKPADPAGTNDETAATKDASGQPISNSARNIWVTETALTTALNMSYMAERLSVFGLVVGVALLLTGIGLVIIAVAVFRKPKEAEVSATKVATSATPVTS
jgi:multisubunit Na+/H+ antiporter MnhC subunit